MRSLTPFLISLLLLLSSVHGAGAARDDGDGGDESLMHRYFLYVKYDAGYDTYKYYLQSQKPVVDPDAKVVLNADRSSVTFTHHIVGRKVNESMEPYVELWVNSNHNAGKVLKVTLRFDADNDGEFESTFGFGPYTTVTTQQAEQLWLNYTSREGTLMDMKEKSGGLVELKVSRVDDQNESLILYCGAYELFSFVDTPYSEPRPLENDGDGGDGGGDGPDAQTLYFAVAIAGLIALGAVLTWLKRKAPPAYTDEGAQKKQAGGKRRRPGGKRRKGRGRRGKGRRRSRSSADGGRQRR
jgi:hypothetical protein